MKAHIAQLAGGSNNADRAFLTDHAAIVLDGATAFLPVEVDPGTYADTLGRTIADQLDHDPAADLRDVVRTAITLVAHRLDLTPGRSPSSTVAILRSHNERADLYVLGDSPIHYGTNDQASSLTDDRLSQVAPTERHRYESRLRAGYGYDDQHSALLVELQRPQRTAVNRPGGYWIAEADPSAAGHGLTRHLPASAITWAVLATDGAAEVIECMGRSWPEIAHVDAEDLATLLAQLDGWETTTDLDGRILPRAKLHDDKTLVAIEAVWC